MIQPTREETIAYFRESIIDDDVYATVIANDFFNYQERHKTAEGDWTVSIRGKRRVMQVWKMAAHTWMRNLKKFNPSLYVSLQSKLIHE